LSSLTHNSNNQSQIKFVQVLWPEEEEEDLQMGELVEQEALVAMGEEVEEEEQVWGALLEMEDLV